MVFVETGITCGSWLLGHVIGLYALGRHVVLKITLVLIRI